MPVSAAARCCPPVGRKKGEPLRSFIPSPQQEKSGHYLLLSSWEGVSTDELNFCKSCKCCTPDLITSGLLLEQICCIGNYSIGINICTLPNQPQITRWYLCFLPAEGGKDIHEVCWNKNKSSIFSAVFNSRVNFLPSFPWQVGGFSLGDSQTQTVFAWRLMKASPLPRLGWICLQKPCYNRV